MFDHLTNSWENLPNHIRNLIVWILVPVLIALVEIAFRLQAAVIALSIIIVYALTLLTISET